MKQEERVSYSFGHAGTNFYIDKIFMLWKSVFQHINYFPVFNIGLDFLNIDDPSHWA